MRLAVVRERREESMRVSMVKTRRADVDCSVGRTRGSWKSRFKMVVMRPYRRIVPVVACAIAGVLLLASPALSAGTWTATGSMNTLRADHTATLLANGKGLVAGGFGPNGMVASAELYDPSTGTWAATGSLNTARDDYTATLLANGKVLVAGGFGPNGVVASAELYDPSTGTWAATGSMNTGRARH